MRAIAWAGDARAPEDRPSQVSRADNRQSDHRIFGTGPVAPTGPIPQGSGRCRMTGRPAMHPRFVTNARGRRTAVQLRLREYQELLEHLEDLEDIAAVRTRRHEKAIPYKTVRREMDLA